MQDRPRPPTTAFGTNVFVTSAAELLGLASHHTSWQNVCCAVLDLQQAARDESEILVLNIRTEIRLRLRFTSVLLFY